MTLRTPLVFDSAKSLAAELQSGDVLDFSKVDNSLFADYIAGLKMVWVSGTALTVTAGSAYIPSIGKVLRAASDIAKTGLSLTASTWYHVYLYDNAGTPDVEIVTTAPAAAYSGTARAKTGDTSRRYVGSVRANSSSALHQIAHSHATGSVKYLVDLNNADLFLVNNGTATSDATVNCASAAPITARVLSGFAENNAASGIVFISNASAGSPATSNILEFIRAGRTLLGEFMLTTSQTLTYMVTGSGALALYATGYVFER